MGLDSDSPLGKRLVLREETNSERSLWWTEGLCCCFSLQGWILRVPLSIAGSGLPLSCVDRLHSFKVNFWCAPFCCAVASRWVSHRLVCVVLRTEGKALCPSQGSVQHHAGKAEGKWSLWDEFPVLFSLPEWNFFSLLFVFAGYVSYLLKKVDVSSQAGFIVKN